MGKTTSVKLFESYTAVLKREIDVFIFCGLTRSLMREIILCRSLTHNVSVINAKIGRKIFYLIEEFSIIEPPGAVTRYAGFHRLLISLITKKTIVARNMFYVGKYALQDSLYKNPSSKSRFVIFEW